MNNIKCCNCNQQAIKTGEFKEMYMFECICGEKFMLPIEYCLLLENNKIINKERINE